MNEVLIKEPKINPDRESKLKKLIENNPNLEFMPIPSVIEELMRNESLTVLDIYLNPGVSGAIFHRYRMIFINKIIKDTGIKTYKELADEAQKILVDKSSKLSSATRKLVVSEFNHFSSVLKSAQDRWNAATKEEQELALELGYLIKTDNDNSRNS